MRDNEYNGDEKCPAVCFVKHAYTDEQSITNWWLNSIQRKE
jgi:hypothetical protein